MSVFLLFIVLSLVFLTTINGSNPEGLKECEILTIPENVYSDLIGFSSLRTTLKQSVALNLRQFISTIESLTPKEQVYWWICFVSVEGGEDSDYYSVIEHLTNIFAEESSNKSKIESWISLAKIAGKVIIEERQLFSFSDEKYGFFAGNIDSFKTHLNLIKECSDSDSEETGGCEGSNSTEGNEDSEEEYYSQNDEEEDDEALLLKLQDESNDKEEIGTFENGYNGYDLDHEYNEEGVSTSSSDS